jgi:hypothetical protein
MDADLKNLERIVNLQSVIIRSDKQSDFVKNSSLVHNTLVVVDVECGPIKALTKEKEEKHLNFMNAVNTAQIADAMRSLLPMLRDVFLPLKFVQYFLGGFIVLLTVAYIVTIVILIFKNIDIGGNREKSFSGWFKNV